MHMTLMKLEVTKLVCRKFYDQVHMDLILCNKADKLCLCSQFSGEQLAPCQNGAMMETP